MLTEEIDPWSPDWKEWIEPRFAHDSSRFDDAFRETECPACGRQIGAFVVDGPDPVFVDLVCPRDVCGHRFTERIS